MPADSVVISVGGQRVRLDGGDYRYVVGPLDLSDRPDGPLPLAVTVTDPAGNSSTSTDSAIKDTVAPEAPTSFTVPESADNGAGVRELVQPVVRDHPGHVPRRHRLVRHADGERRTASTWAPGSAARSPSRGAPTSAGFPTATLDLHGTITDAAGNSDRLLGSRGEGDPAAARRRSPPTSSAPAVPTRSRRRRRTTCQRSGRVTRRPGHVRHGHGHTDRLSRSHRRRDRHGATAASWSSTASMPARSSPGTSRSRSR